MPSRDASTRNLTSGHGRYRFKPATCYTQTGRAFSLGNGRYPLSTSVGEWPWHIHSRYGPVAVSLLKWLLACIIIEVKPGQYPNTRKKLALANGHDR